MSCWISHGTRDNTRDQHSNHSAVSQIFDGRVFRAASVPEKILEADPSRSHKIFRSRLPWQWRAWKMNCGKLAWNDAWQLLWNGVRGGEHRGTYRVRSGRAGTSDRGERPEDGTERHGGNRRRGDFRRLC